MPSDLTLKAMNLVHRAAMTLTRGWLGWTAGSMPVVELTTTGRRSGSPHTVLLTAPLQLTGSYVLVASRGGDDHHPAWFLNLRDNPKVLVRVQGGPQQAMQARVATAEERSELWPQIVSRYSFYGGYQAKTAREIPLVLVAPDEL